MKIPFTLELCRILSFLVVCLLLLASKPCMQGDTVATYGRYTGLDPKPFVSVHIHHVQNGTPFIVEHWDSTQVLVLLTHAYTSHAYGLTRP